MFDETCQQEQSCEDVAGPSESRRAIAARIRNRREIDLIEQARNVGVLDALHGVRVRNRGCQRLLERIWSLFRREAAPLADPFLEAQRQDAYNQQRKRMLGTLLGARRPTSRRGCFR